MKAVGVGIVGYGGFAEFCRQSWSTMDEVAVTAAFDTDPGRNPGDLPFYTSLNNLLQDANVDLVLVATPPSSHAPLGMAALEAGKHVLLEKPPALTARDAAEMVSLAAKKGLVVAVDYMLTYNPIVKALAEVDRSGILGKLQHFSLANYACDTQLGPDHWFWKPEVSGGILVEHAVHFFNMVTSVHASPPVKVTAHGVERQPGMEDKVAILIQHEDGLVASQYHHFFRPGWFERQTYRFCFDLGDFDVEGWIPLTANLSGVATKEGVKLLTELFPGSKIQEGPLHQKELRCNGTDYSVDTGVRMQYAIPDAKSEVYARCVRDCILDVVEGVNQPGHIPKVALAKVLDSIRIAEAGANFNRSGTYNVI